MSAKLFRRLSNAPNGCLIWPGAEANGYGVICYPACLGGGSVLAHRYSWTLNFGAIPEGKLALHTCDVRRCCNPHHLFLGTHLDNTNDAKAKGRLVYVRGNRHGMTKLTAEDVLTIRKAGETSAALSRQFNVSHAAIQDVRHRRSWKYLP